MTGNSLNSVIEQIEVKMKYGNLYDHNVAVLQIKQK